MNPIIVAQQQAALFVPAPGPISGFIQQETGDYLLLEVATAVPRSIGISGQTAAGTLTGTEWLAIVQGGVTKKVALSVLMTYARAN